MMFIFPVLCLSTVFLAVSQAQCRFRRWNYDETELWREQYPMCGEAHQSPIDLDVPQASTEIPVKINFDLEKRRYPLLVINNTKDERGFSYPTNVMGYYIDIDKVRYHFVQGEYHWGRNTFSPGSEHSVNGKFENAEVILTYVNPKYCSFEAAVNGSDTIVLVSILLKEDPKKHPNQDIGVVQALTYMTSQMQQPKPTIKAFEIEDAEFDISGLIPDKRFIYYKGSLSQPPCNRGAHRIVFYNPLSVSSLFFSMFRGLQLEGKPNIGDNSRPIQPTGDTKVYKGNLNKKTTD